MTLNELETYKDLLFKRILMVSNELEGLYKNKKITIGKFGLETIQASLMTEHEQIKSEIKTIKEKLKL